MKTLLVLGILVSLGLFAAERTLDERPSGGECARRMNRLVSNLFGLPVNFSWLGHPGTPGQHGWVRMSVRSFGQLLERVGGKQADMDRLIDLVDGIRLETGDATAFDANHPATLVSFAAAHFFKANTLGRDLYVAIAPEGHSADFPVNHNAVFLFSPFNFSFAPPETCALYPHTSAFPDRLETEMEGIILKMPDPNNEAAYREWIADLIGAFQRWDDLELTRKSIGIGRAANSPEAIANQGWLNRHVGATAEGQVRLDTPYFPLFIEARAEAASAWARLVFRKLGRGSNWEKALREAKKAPNWPELLKEAEDRAFATVAGFTDEKELTPYRKLPDGLYYGHAVKVSQNYRSVIVRRK